MQQKFARVRDHRIAYLEDGGGPPVLLLHGLPSSSLMWRHVIPGLAGTRRVVAPDMLNYGASDRPLDAEVSIAAQSRVIVELMDTLGIARADIVGHDIGGGVAQLIAVNHPERVNRLVLSAAACFDSWPSPQLRPFREVGAESMLSLEAFVAMLRDFLVSGSSRRDALASDALALMVEPWATPAGKRAWFRNMRRLSPEYTLALGDRLQRLEHKTLVMWGRRDSIQSPAYAERLRRTIPGAVLTWIDDAAHFVTEERPVQVSAALRAFLC